MTITKKFEWDDDRVNIIDSDTGVMFTVIKVPHEGYIVDCWTNCTTEMGSEYPAGGDSKNISSMQVMEDEYQESDNDHDTQIPENRQGELNPDR